MVRVMANLTVRCIGWTTAIVFPLAIVAVGNVVFEWAHAETKHYKRMLDLEYERAAEDLRRLKLSPEPKPLEEV